MSQITIAQLIDQLKKDLATKSEGEAMFAITGAEVEISFTAQRDAGGRINFQVVEVGAGKTNTTVHTVRVQLESLVTAEEIRKNLTPQQRADAEGRTRRSFTVD
jgi:Trypsin-co-occurring domain 2